MNFTYKLLPGLLIIFFALLLYSGMQVTPDSLRYIEGAINVSNHKGFVSSCNSLPITYFQPGYSFFMIPFLKMIGTNGAAVLLANSFLFIMASSCIYGLIVQHSQHQTRFFWLLLLLSLFSTLFFTYRFVLSENLNLILIIFYYSLLFKKETNTDVKRIGLLFLIELAMMAIRNQSMLLILPYHIVCLMPLFFRYRFRFLKYRLPIIHALAFAVICWLIKKNTEDAMHPFGFGLGMYSWPEYIKQIVIDLPYFFLGHAIAYKLELSGWVLVTGMIMLIVAILTIQIKKKAAFYIITALALHVFIFSNIWLNAKLEGRFLVWMYLLIFLFSDLKIRRFEKINYVRFGLLGLLIFLAGKGLDIFIFSKPNYYALKNKNLPFNDYIYPYYKFSTQPLESPVVIAAKIEKNEKGEYILTAPCYRWDMK